MDVESNQDGVKKLPYPKAVFFIIVNEFCERFSFNALRAVLVLFLKNELLLSEDESTVMFHSFNLLCYFFPLVGGFVSDSWLGKFRTILYLSIVYAIGDMVLALASWTTLGLPALPLTCVGLFLIALGTGGIKPCVCTFGGDQFTLPEQCKQLETFFSVFYFLINLGVTLGSLIAPLLRTRPCLGEDSCFPAAFGLPAVLMVCFCGVFASGRSMYVSKEGEGNILVQVSKCIGHAAWDRLRAGRRPAPGGHWLDVAAPRYGQPLVEDVKVLLRLMVLCVPMPLFWALFDMIGSRWTFQALQLDGHLGGGWTVQPDQMMLTLGLLVMLLLPAFELWINPTLARMGLLRTPLQRMAVGGLMSSCSFLCAGVLQINVQNAAAVSEKVHILWQLPQYIFMCLAEIWYSIGVLEFSYKEAPQSMKSTILAIYMLTTSVGDTLVIVFTSSTFFPDRSTELFAYAGLMALVIFIFMFLASRYTYVGAYVVEGSEVATEKGEPLHDKEKGVTQNGAGTDSHVG